MPIPTAPLPDSSFPSSSGGADHPTETKPRILHSQATSIGPKATAWKRKPNANNTGATHCRTFHARLNTEACEMMDAQINQWLEEHPELEVKLVTSCVGELQGKTKEPTLIVQVWI